MTYQLIKEIKKLNVLVIHPSDEEGTNLLRHLERIGCKVENIWPFPNEMPPGVDVAFLAIDHDCVDGREGLKRMLSCCHQSLPTIIAVVDYEDPATLQLVLESEAVTVIEKPVRFFGLLTHLTLARNIWLKQVKVESQLYKAQKKLVGVRKVAKAKSILMEMQGISEQDAYNNIRQHAMTKRVAMENIADSIINANELLSK